ncbi:MAG: GNAT family N-acetyltransferase [Siculibacillus sp.]|nr:GNAT family N-acetyltransferase [Siculibacillus sp.]
MGHDLPIETERLILRAHRPEDIEAYAPLWAAPPEGRSFTPVLDGEAAWARLLRLVGHREVFGFAPFLVAERAGGRIVGEVGFAHFRRGIGPEFDEAPEAMWIVARRARGRGYGREATVAVAKWFDERFPGRRSVCMIDPANNVSLRLAGDIGFTAFGHTTRHGTELVLFERSGR